MNITGQMKRRGLPNTLEALATPEGVRLSADHPRFPRIPPCMTRLHDALIRAGCYPLFIGHGARWFQPSSNAAPLFIEKAGAASGGGIILWGPTLGEVAERERVVADVVKAGARIESATLAPGAGYKVTLPVDATDAECNALVAYGLAGHTRPGPGAGFGHLEGAGRVLDDVAPSAAPMQGPAQQPRKGKRVSP